MCALHLLLPHGSRARSSAEHFLSPYVACSLLKEKRIKASAHMKQLSQKMRQQRLQVGVRAGLEGEEVVAPAGGVCTGWGVPVFFAH